MASRKNKTESVIVERWKSGRAYVARDKRGRIMSWRRVKGSKLKLNEARELYKSNKTLFNDRVRIKLTNVSEYTQTILSSDASSFDNRNKRPSGSKPKKDAQYFVSGYFGKKLIVARSFKIGKKMITNSKEAKDDAWRRFLMRVGEIVGNKYDEDEGIKNIDRIKNIAEGWIYYA